MHRHGRHHAGSHLLDSPAMAKRPFERIMLRHHWIRNVISCAGQTGLSLMLWPRFVAPYRFQITRYPMAFPNLPAAFEGYKVLFVTDFHVGKARLSHIERMLHAGVALKPDLILVGGDLIDYWPGNVERLAPLLELLRAPDGAYAVFGNHDLNEYSWRKTGPRSVRRHIHRQLIAALAASPVRLLRNELAAIRRGESTLQIVGIGEMWADQADPDAAFHAAIPAAPIICLQHNPDGYDFLAPYPWHWMLCGHSHGGQVVLPVLGALYVPMRHREWLSGFFPFPTPDGNAKVMFVSRGVGHSEPLRMNCPPEATLFTLTRGTPGEPPAH